LKGVAMDDTKEVTKKFIRFCEYDPIEKERAFCLDYLSDGSLIITMYLGDGIIDEYGIDDNETIIELKLTAYETNLLVSELNRARADRLICT
jgi:hypothetical protein